MKPRILFVDDEVNVLQGLRRMLREKRDAWDLIFAEGGAAAIKILQQHAVDVVVSDMRMPIMDGAQLLEEARHLCPSAARVILSGYANDEVILRTVGPAHQYLAKPCDSAALIKTITSAMDLRTLLASSDLRMLVSGLESLPSPPIIFSRLISKLKDKGVTTHAIAEIINEDVALTAQILKITNSAFFGLPTQITSVEHALHFLGFETINALVAMAGFGGKFHGDAAAMASLNAIRQRSLAIGTLAKKIAKIEGLSPTMVDHAYCAGVLCHVGNLLLIDRWPEKYTKVLAIHLRKGVDITKVERETFGSSHAELGAYLLGLWGFSDEIVEAIAYHHVPSQCTRQQVGVLTVVHVAQALIDEETDRVGAQSIPHSPLDMQYLCDLGLEQRPSVWKDAFHDTMDPN